MSKGSLNQVTLCGNLGADPESRTNTQGNTITMLRVATTRSFKDQQGQYIDQTEWHRVVAYGSRAKYLADYARKGSKVLVEGRIHTRKWQDRNGNDQYTTEIVGEEVQLLDRRQDDHGQGNNQAQRTTNQQQTQSQGQQNPSQREPEFDDDIPF